MSENTLISTYIVQERNGNKKDACSEADILSSVRAMPVQSDACNGYKSYFEESRFGSGDRVTKNLVN